MSKTGFRVSDRIVILKSDPAYLVGKTGVIVEEHQNCFHVFIEGLGRFRFEKIFNSEEDYFRRVTAKELTVILNPAPKLETGMLVQLKTLRILLVINGVMISKDEYERLSFYNADLTCAIKSSEIIKVSKVLQKQFLMPKYWTEQTLNENKLWERSH